MKPKNVSEVTVCQTYPVRIECNVAESEDDREMVIVPLILGQGADWDKIDPEMFEIKDINITINPYYQNSMMVNQSIEGYVSGDYPVYVQAFSGNTYNEGDATKMNELIFTGTYLSAGSNSTIRSNFKSKNIYKTVINTDDKTQAINKEVISRGTVIDGSLLKNPNVVLQLGHIALSIRKEDFQQRKNDSTSTMLSAIEKRRKKIEGIEEKHICKGKMQPKPEPEPSEDNKYVDTPVGGKLICNYQAFIRAEITIAYTRKPY
ncbi:hypothetical protein ENUP19_0011G0029 [Entamoeba nuttalli]|uniref:Uncharacterized protein n=1 Tax=Entamoeba nuttalli TaxID=412467 RepID=A0ABQ0D8A6_9EUKA